ncbi:MAG TPA: flavodoxin family protein [Thermodesulfovibrionales bacterium]|jgi:multimeric flavodoxin WrbA|nr:flavodoxin family protein [Thermodesulfovibrionales bacterium]
MKVIAINGSPHKNGNTYHAINTVCDQLIQENIEVEIIHVGNKMIRGCIACNQCAKKKNEECSITGDDVNSWIKNMKSADGLILGSPVYFAAIAGTMKSFLDRVFRVASVNDGLFRHKVGVSVVADRRTGGIPTFNQLNNYINYAEMFMPSSNYWNVIFGTAPGEALRDSEGIQIMKILGRNMAWLLKSVEDNKSKLSLPDREQKVYMNYIR